MGKSVNFRSKPTQDTFRKRLVELIGEDTQEQFAAKTGVCRATIAGYLIGRTAPSSQILYEICEKTGCSADWLLGLSQNKYRKAEERAR